MIAWFSLIKNKKGFILSSWILLDLGETDELQQDK